jgi:hypothetical protein
VRVEDWPKAGSGPGSRESATRIVFDGEGLGCPGGEDAPLLDGLEDRVGAHLPQMVIEMADID